jgi:excisionase family DNA binding protein
MDAPELLTAREVAMILHVSRASVYRLVAAGELPSLNVGRGRTRGKMIRIPRGDLVSYLAEVNR